MRRCSRANRACGRGRSTPRPCRGTGRCSPDTAAPAISPLSAAARWPVPASPAGPDGRSAAPAQSPADARRSNGLIGSAVIHLGNSLEVAGAEVSWAVETHPLRRRQLQWLSALSVGRSRPTTMPPVVAYRSATMWGGPALGVRSRHVDAPHVQRGDRLGVGEGDRAAAVAERHPQPRAGLAPAASSPPGHTERGCPATPADCSPNSSICVPPRISSVTPTVSATLARYVGRTSNRCGISIWLAADAQSSRPPDRPSAAPDRST